jgi:LDH2 family malate/lactate/ureidoglycolate dehydrogenase
MPSEFQFDVFLSHSAKDKAVMRPLAERLRRDGLKVWFYEWVNQQHAGGAAKNAKNVADDGQVGLCFEQAASLLVPVLSPLSCAFQDRFRNTKARRAS